MDVWCLPKPIFTPLFILHYKGFWQKWRKCCVKRGPWNEIFLRVLGNFANCFHSQGPPLVRTEGRGSLSSPVYILCIISLDFASSSWHTLCFVTSKDHFLLTESHQGSEGNKVQSMFSRLEQSTKVGRTWLSQCVLQLRRNYWEPPSIHQSLKLFGWEFTLKPVSQQCLRCSDYFNNSSPYTVSYFNMKRIQFNPVLTFCFNSFLLSPFCGLALTQSCAQAPQIF